MPHTRAFDKHANAYDDWFEAHPDTYQLELEAIRTLLPASGDGIEIGVGSGRFALPLGIKTGIEPSAAMRRIAKQKSIRTISAVAESLPITSESFDYVLFVTTLCFLDSVTTAFKEAHRILKPGGALLIGFIDKNSALGQQYQQHKHESRFYREATFHSTQEVLEILQACQFADFKFAQTLFENSKTRATDAPVQQGYGKGAFVVIRALKK